jgi:hypothetical protein
MEVILAWFLLGLITVGQGIDFRNEPVQNSPALYYQRKVTARLYASEWRVVTYINLLETSDNVEDTGKDIH